VEQVNKNFLHPLDNIDTAPSDEEWVDQMESVFIQCKVGKQKVGTKEVEVSMEDLTALTVVRKQIKCGYDGDGGSKAGWVHPETLIPLVMDTFINKMQKSKKRG
jgi:hypothetical protein